jgi:hypothetical protein
MQFIRVGFVGWNGRGTHTFSSTDPQLSYIGTSLLVILHIGQIFVCADSAQLNRSSRLAVLITDIGKAALVRLYSPCKGKVVRLRTYMIASRAQFFKQLENTGTPSI